MRLPSTTPLAWLEDRPHYKYREVWQRALVKIRARSNVVLLNQDVKLFGADTLRGDKTADITHPDQARTLIHRQMTAVTASTSSMTVLQPNTKWRLVWSCVYFQLMLYTALIMPYRLAFYEEIKDEWFILDNVVNCLFAVDIILTLNTAYYNKEGELVSNRKAIFLNYLRSWLLIDILACFPFSLVNPPSSDSGTNQYSGLMRFLRLPRLYRLLRLVKIFSQRESHSWFFEKIQELVSLKHSSFRLIVLLTTTAIMIHLMACLWYFVPSMETVGPETWLYARNLQDSSAGEIYMNCLYWTITTLVTVGYGDVVPTTGLEKAVAMIWMLYGVFFISVMVSSFTSLLNSADTKSSLLAGKLAAMDEFAEETKLSKELRFRVRHALRYSAIHTGFSNQVKRGILTELPRTLRFEVAQAMHSGAAKTIPFFSDQDQAFVAAIVPNLNSLLVSEGEVVYSEGDYADEIYFIAQGMCMLMFNSEVCMKRLHRSSYFGEIEVIYMCPRKHTVQACTRTDLLSMNKKLLSFIQSDFPVVYEDLKLVARARNHMNDVTSGKFANLFNSTIRRHRKRAPTRIRKNAGVFSELSEANNPKRSTDERLDEIEDHVKDMRKTLRVLLEGQRMLLPQRTLGTQDSLEVISDLP